MNWKNRLTNYNFWISIASAVLLIMQAFKIEFDVAYINEILTGILGLLVVIGIVSDPTKIAMKSAEKIDKKSNAKEEKKENNLPIENENESDNGYSQVDFQAVVDKISADLNEISIKLEKNSNAEPAIENETKEETDEKTISNDVIENQMTMEENLASETNAEVLNSTQSIQQGEKTEEAQPSAETVSQETEIQTHYNIVN